MTNISDAYLAGLDDIAANPISDEAAEQAAMCFVDYLACTYLGVHLLGQRTRALLGSIGNERGDSALIGMGASASAHTAALINGMHAHAAELDDGHRFGMLHVGAPVISALLATAGTNPMDGTQLLRGIIMGYEATVRLASAVQPGHKLKGFHATGTCGTIGAALGIAYARDFSQQQRKAVLSAAATDAAGLLEMTAGASTLKPYNVGRAAVAAIDAALVGGAGFVGPDDVLGGKRGFFTATCGDVDEAKLLGTADSRYAVQTIYRKPYAACRHCHAAIEAAMLAARNDSVNPDSIEAVEIETYDLAVGGHDHTDILGSSSAKMSIPYSVAAALVFGGADYQHFEPECLADERVQALTKKVAVRESPELSALVPAKRAAIAHIRTSDDAASARVDYPKGEPENPITASELNGKFISLLTAAGVAEPQARELLELAWNVESEFPTLLGRLA